MMEVPTITLDARDIHAAPILKALAAKHRSTNPARADQLDAAAARFVAYQDWKRQGGPYSR